MKNYSFLPVEDPAQSSIDELDLLGQDLPSLLQFEDFRSNLEKKKLPLIPDKWLKHPIKYLSQLRLYYVRIGFIASAYINQVGFPRVNKLPANIAIPLTQICKVLNRPPILSYDGYALYNWKRFDTSKSIALGNIDTIQNFVHMYDEHWFILVHVEIEALASRILRAILYKDVDQALKEIADCVNQQCKVLSRIPEKMDPALYYKTFRCYIRFFENIVYEGCHEQPMNYRGETGAQSSIIPILVAFLKIPHQPTMLTNHLLDMRNFMPVEHRSMIEEVERMPPIKDKCDKDLFNDVLEAIASFREIHYKWAVEYINNYESDNRGTGGTPYMQWLKQLIDETRQFKF